MQSIEGPIKKHKTIKYYLRLVFLILFLSGELIWMVFYYVNQPSEEKRAFLFGFSLIKLSIIIFLIFIVVALFVLSVSIVSRGRLGLRFEAVIGKPKIQKSLMWFFSLFGTICWIVFFTPLSRFNHSLNYVNSSRPLLLLGILISVQIIIYLLSLDSKGKVVLIHKFLNQNKSVLMRWGGILILLMMVWAYIAITKVGLLKHAEDYWYEAGVPVLGLQLLAALTIGIVFVIIEKNWRKLSTMRFQVEIAIFAMIWIIGGALWAQTSLPNGYFNPGPYPPTYETYPFSDAARYDLMSQYALIGQGVNDGRSYNRPAYPAFLVFIHILSGQNYDKNMQLQAAIFGIFPALIYLIVRLLSNRGAGIATAAVIIMRGINGIEATNILNLANQKQMLTDFPTAIGVGAILFLCLLWIRKPSKLWIPLLAGGLFSMTLYVRQTILGILPIILVLPAFHKGYSRKIQAAMVGIFLLGIFALSIPQEFKSIINSPHYTYPATIKKIISVINSRYPQVQKNTHRINTNDTTQATPTTPEEGLSDGEIRITQIAQNDFEIIENHFFHNVVASILVLPNSLTFNDLEETLKGENSLWAVSWDGRLSFAQYLVLFINNFLISLGISISMRVQGFSGLLPILFFIGYNFTNALARTSGGRYIVPADWIIIVYFVVGFFQIFLWFLYPLGVKKNSTSNEWVQFSEKSLRPFSSLRGMFATILLVFFAGMFLIVPDYIFTGKFEKIDREQLIQKVIKYDLLDKQDYIEKILDSRNSTIVMGQIMYPRYYLAGRGEISYYYPYKPLDYSRLGFYLIGADGTKNVLLAGSLPRGLTNASTAIVIGCKERGFVDAVIIVITNPTQKVFFRDPLPDLVCPLPSP
jgi:hypothetical protein